MHLIFLLYTKAWITQTLQQTYCSFQNVLKYSLIINVNYSLLFSQSVFLLRVTVSIKLDSMEGGKRKLLFEEIHMKACMKVP